MNKKWGFSSLAVLAVCFVTDYLIHQVWLKDLYHATANLWRADMSSYMGYMFGGEVVTSIFVAALFGHGYKGKGMSEGARFGVLLGGLAAGNNLMMYAVEPYTMQLTVSWIVAGFAQGICMGLAAAAVWGKTVPTKK